MLYHEKEDLLLATGLNIRQIAKLIADEPDEKTLLQRLEKLGKKYAHRYSTFEKYKQLVANEALKEPIVLVVGGLPCTGKTTLSRELAARFGIGTVISGDAVRESLRELVSEKDHPEFFTSVYASWKFFGDSPTKEAVVKGYRKQSEIVSRVLQKIVWRAAVKDGESMVVEYLHFLPEFLEKDLLGHVAVIPIILKVSDEEIHQERVRSRTNFHHKGGWQRLIENLKQYRIMQDYQVSQAEKYNVAILENKNWDDTIDKALDLVFERIEKLNASAEKK